MNRLQNPISAKAKVVLGVMLNLFSNLSAQSPSYKNFSIENGLITNTVYEVAFDSTNLLWMATDRGMSSFNGRRFIHYDQSNGLAESEILRLIPSKKFQMVGLGIGGSINAIDDDSAHVIHSAFSNGVSVVGKEAGEKYYVSVIGEGIFELSSDGVRKQISQYDTRNFHIVQNELYTRYYDNTLMDIESFERTSNHWSIEDRKLVRIDSAILTWHQNEIKITGAKESLVDNLQALKSVDVSYYDQAENQLVLGVDYTVHWFEVNQNGFFQKQSCEFPSQVSAIAKDNEGGYWIGTLNSGLFYIPRLHTEKMRDGTSWLQTLNGKTYFTDLGNTLGFFEDNHTRLVYSENPLLNVSRIRKFDNNLFWIGSELSLMTDLELSHVQPLFFNIKDILKIDNRFYLATSKGISEVSSKDFKNFYSGTSTENTILLHRAPQFLGRVTQLELFKDQIIIVSRNSILFADHKLTIKNKINFDSWVKEVQLMDDNLLWVSVNGLGDYYVHLENGTTVPGEFETGLVENRVHSDSTSFVIWNNGVFFDKNTVIGYANGVFSKSINSIALIKNELWIATNQGIFRLPHKKILRKMPPLLGVLNNEQTVASYNYNDPVSFGVSPISYLIGDNLQFQYRLTSDTPWISSLDETIILRGLKQGLYTPQIRLSSSEFSDKVEVNLKPFKVHPPWWENPWVVTGFFTIIVGVILGASRQRIQQLRKESLMEKQIRDLTLEAAQSQLQPHFVFNMLNSIRNLMQENETDKAILYLTKFSKLLRTILRNADKYEHSLKEELDLAENYLKLEQMRLANEFSFELSVDSNIDLEETQIPYLMLQPILENAIWHGLHGSESNNKHISISLTQKSDFVEIDISDNGRGFDSTKTPESSKGLSILRRKIELFGAIRENKSTLEISSLLEKGTTANIKLYD